MPAPLRPFWLNMLGARVHPSSMISSGVRVTGRQISIGARSFVNRGVFIDALAPVDIGSNVAIGMGVYIVTSSHEIGSTQRRAGTSQARPVVIADGTWVGARALILPGATIGAGTVIAAGAVVAGKCEPDSLYAGVPAKLIRRLDLDAAE